MAASDEEDEVNGSDYGSSDYEDDEDEDQKRPKDLEAAYARTKELQLQGSPFAMAAQLGIPFEQIIRMKRVQEAKGKWHWRPKLKVVRMHRAKERLELAALKTQLEEAQRAAVATPKAVPRARDICTWVQTDGDGDVWCCNNHVLRHPFTRELTYYCGYHTSMCVYPHPGGQVVRIQVPNEEAACTTHWASRHLEPPEAYSSRFDIPGTVVQSFNLIDIGVPTHALAPELEDTPRAKRLRRIPTPEPEPSGIIDKLVSAIESRYTAFTTGEAELHLADKRGAIAMQSLVRGYLVRKRVTRLRAKANIARRATALAVLQHCFRGLLCRRRFRKLFARMKAAVRLIEKRWLKTLWWRGIARILKQQAAARTIQKFFKAKSASARWGIVRARVKARARGQRKLKCGAAITRIGRGFLGRQRARKLRAWRVQRWRAAIEIQRVVRGYLARRVVQDIHEEIEHQNREVDAGAAITRVGRGFLARLFCRRWKAAQPGAAVMIQRCIRGRWGRRRAHKMREARERIWTWLSPMQPRSTFNALTYRVPYEERFDLTRFLRKQPMRAAAPESYIPPEQAALWIEEQAMASRTLSDLNKAFCTADPMNSGLLSAAAFQRCMLSTGMLFSQDGLARLCRLFVEPQTGKIHYPSFSGWARRQVTFCAKHRMLFCPSCFHAAGCRKCACSQYRERSKLHVSVAQPVRRVQICTCGHHQDSHVVTKSDATTTAHVPGKRSPIAERQFQKIFTQQPAAMPDAEADRLLTASRARIADTEAVVEGPHRTWIPARLASPSRSRTATAERTQQLADLAAAAVQALAHANTSVGPSTALTPQVPQTQQELDDRLYNDASQHRVSLLEMSCRGDLARSPVDKLETVHSRQLAGYSAHVDEGHVAVLRDAKYLEQVLIGMNAGMESTQSLETYRWRFGITRPVPIVKHGTLRLSTDPVAVYLHLYRALVAGPAASAGIAQTDADVILDHGRLMSLIMNHHSFLERHWRKLVRARLRAKLWHSSDERSGAQLKDVRSGTLDVLLPISEQQRAAEEATMVPHPERADYLDQVFRALGYHARASATDRLGQLRVTTVSMNQFDQRRPALDGLDPATVRLSQFPKQPSQALAPPNWLETLSASRTQSSSAALAASPVSRKRLSTASGPAQLSRSPGPNWLNDVAHQSRPPTANKAHTLKGQLSDVGVADIHSKLLALPRTSPGPKVHVLPDRARPFLCTHAGCGRAFVTQSTLEFHFMHAHKDHTRLRVALPKVDHAMSAYWPDAAPWRVGGPMDVLQRDIVADGCRFVCAECSQRFMKPSHLRTHCLTQHSQSVLLRSMNPLTEAEPHPGITWAGLPMRVPPSRPPIGATVVSCAKHQWLSPKLHCDVCAAVASMPQPTPPMVFYPSVTMEVFEDAPDSVRQAIAVLDAPELPADGDVSGRDLPAVLMANAAQPTQPWVIRVAGLCQDKLGANWVGGYRMWNLQQLEAAGHPWSPRYSFDKAHELLASSRCEWFPLEQTVGGAVVSFCAAAVFNARRQDGTLPRDVPVYFCREPVLQDV